MVRLKIDGKALNAYVRFLRGEERTICTIEKYLRDVRAFASWLGGRSVTKELVCEWKVRLAASGLSASTINGALAALHSLFAMLGRSDIRVKYLRVQRRVFCDSRRELGRDEYMRLVGVALNKGDSRLALLLETICGTGVRVSELRYLTVEAAHQGRVDIALKGKIRTVLISGKLAKKLLRYAQKQKIAAGEIFRTASGRGMDRRQIWREMKNLCREAHVDSTKVFPHNLRHLFARTYFRLTRNIVQLADILGHSSIETTRIYLVSSGAEHARRLEQLGLVT